MCFCLRGIRLDVRKRVHPFHPPSSRALLGVGNPLVKGKHLLTAGEPVADHVARNVAGQVTSAESASSDAGGVAELVATGEGQGVHDGKDKSDD